MKHGWYGLLKDFSRHHFLGLFGLASVRPRSVPCAIIKARSQAKEPTNKDGLLNEVHPEHLIEPRWATGSFLELTCESGMVWWPHRTPSGAPHQKSSGKGFAVPTKSTCCVALSNLPVMCRVTWTWRPHHPQPTSWWSSSCWSLSCRSVSRAWRDPSYTA